MTTASVCLGGAAAAAPRMLLSRNAFAAMLVVLAAAAATSQDAASAPGATAALINGIAENKVLWLCLGVALWRLLCVPAAALRARDLAAGAPALLLSACAVGIWPWIGLSVSFLLLLAGGSWGRARDGVLIALAAGLHETGVNLLGELSGDVLLGVDAWIAGSLSGLLLHDLAVQGNALQHVGGHMVVLVWGCSSLSNLGDALLLFWALVSLGAADVSTGRTSGRFAFCMLILAAVTIMLNAVRLMLMAGSPEAYVFLHGSDGAALFRLATLCITAVLSALAVWR